MSERNPGLIKRPRRLRSGEILRKMVRETRMDPSSLIYPVFLTAGTNRKEEISSMEGQYRYSIDRMEELLIEIMEAGIRSILLFGVPSQKDEYGSGAYAEDGIVQQGLRKAKAFSKEIFLISDVCLCEYTSHGHCGILKGNEIENDPTLKLLAQTALSQVQAGADMVAPSDMMDGRVRAIRSLLDHNEFHQIPILSYSVKYASAFYGPFRQAVASAPAFGDRKTHQMDYHNRREGIKAALLDEAAGADILMVKPALAYGDLIHELKEATQLPIASYSVSGEYAMVKAAVKSGFVDAENIMCEMAVSAYRAGSDLYITYFAKELAECMRKGKIG